MGMPILPTMGVNLLDDPRRIRDDECVYAKNLVPFTKGLLGKRPGSRMLGTLPSASYQGKVVAIAQAPFTGANYVQINKFETGFHILLTDLGTSYVDIEIVLRQIAYAPALVGYLRKMYVFPGYPCTTNYVVDQVGVTESPFLGTNNGISPAVACVYRNRLVYGNFGPGFESRLLFADPYNPMLVGNDVLAANGRSFDIGPDDGDRIVALVEVTQTAVGSPASSVLLILKENSAYILSGEPNYTTDTSELLGDTIISKISYDCGCSSAQTVKTTPFGTLWAGKDDVWFFAAGSLPVRVGSNIRPVLEASPASMRWQWHAEYFGGFYRLALFAPGQSPNDKANLAEQWWLDLRDGVELIRWWGPQIYNSNNLDSGTGLLVAGEPGLQFMFQAKAPGSSARLLGVTGYTAASAVGSTSTFLLELDASEPRDGGLDHALPSYATPDITWSDNMGTEVLYELKTKEYDFDSPYFNKLLRGVKVDFWTSITQYLKAAVILNGQPSSAAELSAVVETSGLIMDADQVETEIGRTFQEKYLIDSDTNLVGKTIQLKFYDEAGYVISDSNNALAIFVAAPVFLYYTATLTNGHYATLKDLLDHLCARILAATGLNATHDVLGAGPSNRSTTITINHTLNVSYRFATAGGSVTESDMRKSRALMSMLGWDVSANTANGIPQVSSTPVYYKRAGSLEISNLEVDLRTFEREPT